MQFKRIGWANFFLLLLSRTICLLLLIPTLSRADSIENAVNFLGAGQRSDGSWTSTNTTQFHTTTEALRALQTVDADAAVRSAAADFLQTQTPQNVDDLARRIDALAIEERDVSAAVNNLLANADPLGGWGLTSDFVADPLDTALALVALASADLPNVDEVAPALGFLARSQNQDGGWGCVRDGPSEVSCTAQVLIALNAHDNHLSLDAKFAAVRARLFLKTALHLDGSIGGSAADPVYTTALAARALTMLDNELGDDRPTVITYVEGQQSPDGSWRGDPFLTAVALRAVDGLVNVPLCGDGVINRSSESCDGLDLGGKTCDTFGFDGGTLSCSATCTFNTSACIAPNNPPEITSAPVTSAAVGEAYSYDVEALDPNADGLSSKMYWTDPGTDGVPSSIRRANLDGSNVEDLLVGEGSPFAITIDPIGRKFYWSDFAGDRISTIKRADLNGLGIEHLLLRSDATYGVYGIALDLPTGKMYWTDGGGRIFRANLDGSAREEVLNLGSLIFIRGITVDSVNRKLYWTTVAGGLPSIQRADLDGSNGEILVTNGLNAPLDVEVDPAGGKVYWAEGSAKKIQRANLDGSNVEDLVTSLRAGPQAIALDIAGGKIYWALGFGGGGIQRANLDGTEVEDLVTGLAQPKGIALLLDPPPPLKFSLDVAPEGMTIDETTGLIQWTPTDTQVGEHQVVVRVVTSDGRFVLQSFVVTVPAVAGKSQDKDGDGFTQDEDCDDTNPSVNPGATEILGDGIDDDCNPGTPDQIVSSEFSCTVTTDKTSYGAQETMQVDVVVKRTGGQGSVVGLQLQLNANSATGDSVGTVSEALTALGPDERQERSFFFLTGDTPPGVVTVALDVMADAEAAASCSAETAIVSSTTQGVQFAGAIVADPAVAEPTDTVTARYSVKNVGNVALDPVDLEILVVNVATENIVATLTDSTSLAVGAIFESAQALLSGLAAGDYLLILQGSSGGALKTIASAPLQISGPANQSPTADAGDDQNIETGVKVTLDGSDSFDPEGEMITYAWSFVSVPAGSQLTDEDIEEYDTPTPSFTPDVAGEYIVQLIVRDAQGAESSPDEVMITATPPNVPPNADAGPNQNVELGNTVVIDGSNSDDPDQGPGPMTFVWGFVAVPAASALTNADITNANQAEASFTPDVPGIYRLQLVVGDGKDSDADEVDIMVTIPNVSPNADAGEDQLVTLGDEVTLDGTASQDPDAGPQALSYQWSFVSVPTRSALINDDITDAETPTARFLPDVEGNYVLRLAVFDGKATDADNVLITVTCVKSERANPDVLWPPDHKMTPVTISVSNVCTEQPVCQIDSVRSNEPINGVDDGDTAPDWEITDNLTLNLRAERSGIGTGRVYTIEVQCTNGAGNSSKGVATVIVPYNREEE